MKCFLVVTLVSHYSSFKDNNLLRICEYFVDNEDFGAKYNEEAQLTSCANQISNEDLSSSPIRSTDEISKEPLSSENIQHIKETSKEIISSSHIQTTEQTSRAHLSLSEIEPINQPSKDKSLSHIEPTDKTDIERSSSSSIVLTEPTIKVNISSHIKPSDQTGKNNTSSHIKPAKKPGNQDKFSHIKPTGQARKSNISGNIKPTGPASKGNISSQKKLTKQASESNIPSQCSQIKPKDKEWQLPMQLSTSDQKKETSKLPEDIQQLTNFNKQSINIIKSEIQSLKSKIYSNIRIIPGNIDKDKVVGITGVYEQLFVLTEGRHVRIRTYNLITLVKMASHRLKFEQGPGNRFNMAGNIFNLADLVTNTRDGAMYILSKNGFIFCLGSGCLPLLSATWQIHPGGSGLFLTAAESILVTYDRSEVVHEYSIYGEYLREIILNLSLRNWNAFSPQHVISLNPNKFVICHGDKDYKLNGLFSMDSNARQSNANQRNSGCSLHLPIRIIVDGQNRLLILDKMNFTVRLFDEKLRYIDDVIVFDEEFYERDSTSLTDYPHRFWKDINSGNLLLIDVVFRRNTTVLVPNNLNLKH